LDGSVALYVPNVPAGKVPYRTVPLIAGVAVKIDDDEWFAYGS